MNNKILISILSFTLCGLASLAQIDDDLGVQEIQVTKSFIPSIPEANKLLDIPTLSDTIKISKLVSYSPINKRFESQLSLSPIQAAKIKGEPLSKLYSTYIYGGVGNMSMPTARLFYSSDRNKSLSYALSLGYIESYANVNSVSDKDQKVSAAFRETDFSTYLKKDFDFGIFNANISRQGNLFQAYGHNPSLKLEEKLTEEYWGYSTLSLSLQSKNTDKGKPSYYTKLFAYDLNEKTENTLSWMLSLSQSFGMNSFSLGLAVDYDLNNLSDKYVFADSLVKELIITLRPSWSRPLGGGDLNVGFQAISRDSRDSSDIILSIFPQIRYDYVFSENFQRAYLGVRGGLVENSYWTLSKKNPFVFDALNLDGGSLNLVNGQVNYDFYLGLNSYLGANIKWSSELSYGRKENMVFFELDRNSTYQNKFNVVYDDVNHLKLKAFLNWNININSNLDLKLEYNKYDLDSISDFAYKPRFKSNLNYSYNIGDKIIPSLELVTAINRSTATDSTSSAPILNDIYDINLALEYRYNNLFSAYFKANNLIGGYQTWENYPVLGPQVFFGLSFRL